MPKKSTKKPKKAKKTKRKNKRSSSNGLIGRLIKFAFKWGLVVGLWLSIIVGGIVLWYAQELPDITKDMVFERRPTIIIKASNGEVVDRYGDIKGQIVDVKNLPPHVINAVMAIEDRRFYSHFGMDLKGFARALFVNVSHGGFVQGGSTITQQLAKNLFLSRERTLKRKIQELILSFQLEHELTKDEILSAYLNRVYLGSGAYGIDGAARVYFNKSANELDIREAATIAGLLKAPSRYSPNNNPELSKKRTKVVMQSMVDAGYIEQGEFDSYKNIPPAPRRKPSSGSSVRYFTDYIVNQLDDLVGPFESDITVETTLNQATQQEMEEAITKAILEYGPRNEVEQAAGIFMRLDGAVVAMMGGKNYQKSEFNRTTEAFRQPGSSFKPIVYLTALENGFTMNTLVEDEPLTTGRYRPRNFGGKYMGEVTLMTALTNSLNTVAVQLMRAVGVSNVIDMARRLGITADLEPNLSTALGSSGVPMIQMVTAYTTLGRGGSVIDPYSIARILDKEGNVLYERTPPQTVRHVVAMKDVAQINAMMRSVVLNGTGRGAILPYPSAGKTGTSQDYRDAWFIGFTNKYAGAIWFGNDDNSPTKRLTGGSAPARVWREVMSRAQTQGGKAYSSFIPVDGGAFDNLLNSILNSDESRGGSWFGGLFNDRRKQRNAPQEEYTPLGRHQWEVNE